MRVEESLVDGWVVTLELPDDWVVGRHPERSDTIVAGPGRGDVRPLWIAPALLGSHSLWEVALAAMRPYAGAPETFHLTPAVLAGRGAFCWVCGDGVMNVASWWLALDRRWAACIDYGDPDETSAMDGVDPRDAAEPLLRGLSFARRAPTPT